MGIVGDEILKADRQRVRTGYGESVASSKVVTSKSKGITAYLIMLGTI